MDPWILAIVGGAIALFGIRQLGKREQGKEERAFADMRERDLANRVSDEGIAQAQVAFALRRSPQNRSSSVTGELFS